MSIAQLCEMGTGIRNASEPDAVLFLWVTAPMLPDGLELVKAWGFTFKTHYIWYKVKHNFGHYSSVRHENLFICTRGNCTPPEAKAQQYNSVVSLERSDRHSEKPEYFRELIDRLYPHGNRIELFA